MRTKVRMSLVPFLFLAVAPGPLVGLGPVQPLLQALSASVSANGQTVSATQGCHSVGMETGGTARVLRPGAQAPAGHPAIMTMNVRRAGTLTLPAGLREEQVASTRVGPGTYAWILGPEARGYTWSFSPAEGGRLQVLTVTHDGSAYRVGPVTADLTAALDESDLSTVTSLTLPTGFRAVDELCRLPALKELKLSAPSDLPLGSGTEATDRFPYRIETPHGVFLGDKGMSMVLLARYATVFESTTLPELERDTGLRPTTGKAVFLLYGDKAHWDEQTGSSPYWGYYLAQEHRIAMAHWKTPESVNSLLLAHEFFHWLAWEEGSVNLPTWLNEGLAHNLSWRVEQHADTWMGPFIRREWLRIANHPNVPVPALSEHTEQDEFTMTAVGHLLQTRGRDALVPFFERTRAGMAFAEAFRESFGVTPAAFEREYRDAVRELRKGH